MAMKQMMFLLMCGCILAALTTKGAYGVSTSAPLNRVVYEGATNTTITCKSKDSFMDWSIIPYPSIGSSSGKTLTRNGKIISPFNDSFAVDHSEGTDAHTLVIYSATISPSGRAKISTTGFYQCKTNVTMTAAQLVVVRSDPICSSNIPQSTVSCTIVYGGYREFPIDAVISWSVNGQPIPSGNAQFTINTAPTEITATSILVVSQDSDATYECATKFSKTANNRYADVAKNAPDYYKTCTISITAATKTTASQSKTSQQATTSSLSPTTTTTAAAIGSFVSISLAPLNRVVYEGATNTTITCDSNDTFLDWLIFPFADTASSGLYQLTTNGHIQYPFNESFTIDHLQEVYTLVVFNATISPSDRATFSTAGIYQCYNTESGSAAAVQLVVVPTDPTCSSSVSQPSETSDDVKQQVSCTIVYGSPRRFPIDAVIRWSINGLSLPANISTFTINASSTEITATSTIVLNSLSDATFECAVTFSQPADALPTSVAKNAPDYFKTCTISGYPCQPNLKNMAVYEEQLDILMNLVTDTESVSWSVQPSSDELNIQNIIDIGGIRNPSLIDLFDVKETGLVIKKATVTGDPISTAGLYVGKCADSTDNVGAKFLVIRTGPQCSHNSIDTSSSGVSCNITFADSVIHPIRPIVTWSLNGEFLATYTLQMERIIGDVFYAESTIATKGGANDNYQCEVTFDAPVDIQYPWIATNAPEFKKSCSIAG